MFELCYWYLTYKFYQTMMLTTVFHWIFLELQHQFNTKQLCEYIEEVTEERTCFLDHKILILIIKIIKAKLLDSQLKLNTTIIKFVL